MLLLEVAIQGVRGLPKVGAKLHPLTNAFVGRAAQLGVLQRALRALLMGPRDNASVEVEPGAALAQGAVTVALAGGAILRLGRDLVSGRARLAQHTGDKHTFVPITDDTHEAMQYLCSTAGFCDPDTFERCFMFSPEQLPSHTVQVVAQSSDATQPTVDAGADLAVVRQQLAEIEKQLQAGRQTENIEFELDGLQKRRFAIDDELRAYSDPNAAVGVAQARLDQLAKLPADFDERYSVYQIAVMRRAEDLKRWEQEHERLVATQPRLPATSAMRSRPLWIGLTVGLAGWLLAMLFGGSARYAALLELPGFGLAAFLLWQRYDVRDRCARHSRRLQLSLARADKIKSHDAELVTLMEATLKTLGLSSREDVASAVKARHHAVENLRAAVAARGNDEGSERRMRLVAEREKLDRKIAALEEKLTHASAGIDFGSLRSMAQKLRLRLENGAVTTSTTSSPRQLDVAGMATALVQSACNLWLMGRPEATERLASLASPILAALTNRRLSGIELTSTEAVLLGQEEQPVAWSDVDARLRDQVYLALRYAIVGGSSERSRMPVLLTAASEDEGFVSNAERWLGHSGQMLVFSQHDVTGGETATVRLSA